MKVEKYPGNKYKEKLKQRGAFIENINSGPVSDDIIVYNRRGIDEKIEIINSLYHKALEFMEEPKNTLLGKVPKWLADEGVKELPSWVEDLGIDLEAVKRERNYHMALENQDYTCLLCDISVNPEHKQPTKEVVAKEILVLKPHRIVHDCFKGDYELENIAILCPDCHKKESTIFNRSWNEFFENGRVMEWKKLIHKSFNFLKDFISQQ